MEEILKCWIDLSLVVATDPKLQAWLIVERTEGQVHYQNIGTRGQRVVIGIQYKLAQVQSLSDEHWILHEIYTTRRQYESCDGKQVRQVS